jgi:hypothetical protein
MAATDSDWTGRAWGSPYAIAVLDIGGFISENRDSGSGNKNDSNNSNNTNTHDGNKNNSGNSSDTNLDETTEGYKKGIRNKGIKLTKIDFDSRADGKKHNLNIGRNDNKNMDVGNDNRFSQNASLHYYNNNYHNSHYNKNLTWVNNSRIFDIDSTNIQEFDLQQTTSNEEVLEVFYKYNRRMDLNGEYAHRILRGEDKGFGGKRRGRKGGRHMRRRSRQLRLEEEKQIGFEKKGTKEANGSSKTKNDVQNYGQRILNKISNSKINKLDYTTHIPSHSPTVSTDNSTSNINTFHPTPAPVATPWV